MNYPIYDFGGDVDAPVMHIAVANGFPPQTYIPMVRPLLGHYHVVSLLPRALWPEEQDHRTFRSWRMLSADILEGLQAHDLHDVTLVGHSFGGVASMLAATEEPDRVRALVLLDPTFIMFSLPTSAILWLLQRLGMAPDRLPLVRGALRRRRTFASAEAAYTYFSDKRLFADWPDETVRLYADSITREDGDGVALAWSPEWEAQYYRTVFPWSWREIPKLRGLLPLLTLRGARSDTLTPEAAARLQQCLPEMAYDEIDGGHLFPQSAPDSTATAIMRWLT